MVEQEDLQDNMPNPIELTLQYLENLLADKTVTPYVLRRGLVVKQPDNSYENVSNTYPFPIRIDADQGDGIRQALNEIYSGYGDTVSVENKKKSLLKFGSKTTVGTSWETMMTARGSEVQETLLSTNGITTIVSDNPVDTRTLKLEYHTISTGLLTFGVQEVTLQGTTPVTLPTPCARASRMYNNDTTALVGNIYVYEGGTRTNANTHLVISAGEQQTQKAATAISNFDYAIIKSASINVLSKVTKYAEARIEIRAVGKTYWRPITQTFSTTDNTGTIQLFFDPHKIVPANHDARLAVKTNTGGVDVSGGFNAVLAN